MRRTPAPALAVAPFALASLALGACSSGPSADFDAAPAPTGSCVQDCRLTIINQSEQQVVVSAYRGSVLQPLGTLPPRASQAFMVPRSVTTVVAEVGNQEYCRGPVRWRADGTADFIVGGASCRM